MYNPGQNIPFSRSGMDHEGIDTNAPSDLWCFKVTGASGGTFRADFLPGVPCVRCDGGYSVVERVRVSAGAVVHCR